MKQVTSIPVHGQSANQQQPPVVKDSENFTQLVKHFSCEVGEHTNQDHELKNSESAEIVDTPDATDTKDGTEEVTTDDSKQSEEVPTNVAGQIEAPLPEMTTWAQLLGVQAEISNELLFEGNHELQQTNNEPVLSSQKTEVGTATDLGALDSIGQLTEASLQSRSSFGTTLEASTVFSNQDSSETGVANMASELGQLVAEAEESIDLQGIAQQGNVTESQPIGNMVSPTIINATSEQSIANQATNEIAIEVLPIASDSLAGGLQQSATVDVSNLLTVTNQATTSQEQASVTAKQAVEPLTQKVEQLIQSSEKKITLQLLPEKLGKVQIALEVNAQGSRLEFTVEQQQTKQLLTSIKSELDQVLQKQETRLFSISESNTKEMATTSIERSNLAQGSLANFASTTDGQSAQQSFSQPQRHTGKKVFNPVTIAKEESSELVNHAISILA